MWALLVISSNASTKAFVYFDNNNIHVFWNIDMDRRKSISRTNIYKNVFLSTLIIPLQIQLESRTRHRVQ
jgi:hypothetical protein